ncbi:MAG: energy transducer TonB [Muribaculaceae bacterium]|nr:energy transducer TonB [Muribaculaceae bacterium]
MAKDVDLSSREWLDLVFEGKNKDFGAYEIRNDSAKRHNKSVLYTIIGIVAVAALAFAYTSINQYLTEQRLKQERLEQERIRQKLEKEEPEQEKKDIPLPPPEKKVIPEEEVQKTVKLTEYKVVADKEVKEIIELIDKETLQDAKADTKTQEGHAPTAESLKLDNTPEPTKIDPEKTTTPDKPEKPEPKPESNEVFKSAATMPSFPGGNGALMSYINKHIKYPQSAQDNNIQGKVVVQFVVEKDGSIGEVKVVRSVDKALDSEAKRVCKSLPKFSPGKNANGDPVRVWYTLPVQFKLQGAN